jgi:HSP20 family protein
MTLKDLRVSPAEDQDDPDPQAAWLFRMHDWRQFMPRRHVWRPPTDIYETDTHVVIKLEIAGMTDQDFQISLEDRCLTIIGHRKDPVGKIIYQNMEIRYGEFRTEIYVGWAVDQSAIEAIYEAGFLFVKLPKAKETHVSIHVRDTEDL